MKKNQPPRLAKRFFSWYCRNHLRESILGDLEERFYYNQQKHGTWRAKWLFWIGVLRFINRFTLKKDRYSINYYTSSMFKNNLISSLRFLKKNKGFTLINTFGLTLGFTSVLLILVFVRYEFSFDQFHPNSENVFRVNFSFKDNAGNVTTLVNSPPALAPGIAGKFPEIDKISRMRYAMNCLLANGDVRFYEDHGYYADSLFLEILQFELVAGDPLAALDQPNTIVITEEMALKYFNDPNPLGATLLLNNEVPLKVTGILSSLPSNSHLNFDFLLSFSTYILPDGYASDLTSWSWLGFLTYMELKPNVDPVLVQKKLAQHFQDLDPDNPTPMIPVVQILTDIYLGSTDMADDLASHIRSGNRFSVNALTIVALLILVIAGFNFSNLTHALSINRSKATGVRKVLGASKRSVISQLLTESLLLTLICLIMSVGILMLLFPAISSYMRWEFSLGLEEIIRLVPIMLAASLFIGSIAGFYPALVLARFDISQSLKGTLKIGSRNPLQLKNVLVMLQLSISIGLIATAFVMTQQINYLSTKNTGYDAENVVLVKMLPEEMSQYFETFKEQLVQQASVVSVSRSERVVGEPWPWSIILRTDQDPENSKRVFFNQADYDYFQTMGIPIHEGRAFSREHVNDPNRSIIINKFAADYLELEDPVGKQVHFFEMDGPRTIVGVVEDFNYTSLHTEIGPAVMILPFIDLEHMYIRFTPGNLQSQIETLESSWEQVSPGSPLSWRFLDDNLDQLYQSEEKLSTMIQVFSGLAILLACLGLFGIVAFMINNQIKEFGIRKVLGASIGSLYVLFTKKYIYQLLLAMVAVFPIVHYLLNQWLADFAYHIEINWLIYPLATLMMMLLVLVTISFQTLKAAQANPTELLRDE